MESGTYNLYQTGFGNLEVFHVTEVSADDPEALKPGKHYYRRDGGDPVGPYDSNEEAVAAAA